MTPGSTTATPREKFGRRERRLSYAERSLGLTKLDRHEISTMSSGQQQGSPETRHTHLLSDNAILSSKNNEVCQGEYSLVMMVPSSCCSKLAEICCDRELGERVRCTGTRERETRMIVPPVDTSEGAVPPSKPNAGARKEEE